MLRWRVNKSHIQRIIFDLNAIKLIFAVLGKYIGREISVTLLLQVYNII